MDLYFNFTYVCTTKGEYNDIDINFDHIDFKRRATKKEKHQNAASMYSKRAFQREMTMEDTEDLMTMPAWETTEQSDEDVDHRDSVKRSFS